MVPAERAHRPRRRPHADGGYGSDYFLVGLWGEQTGGSPSRTASIAAGNPDDDTNVLIVNGSLAADTFLFRRDLIAHLALNAAPTARTPVPGAPRRSSTTAASTAACIVNGLDGDDTFALDDTSPS